MTECHVNIISSTHTTIITSHNVSQLNNIFDNKYAVFRDYLYRHHDKTIKSLRRLQDSYHVDIRIIIANSIYYLEIHYINILIPNSQLFMLNGFTNKKSIAKPLFSS
jgi:hypothetical protein